MRLPAALSAGLLAAAACGGGTTTGPPNLETLPSPTEACANVAQTTLSVGAYSLIDPAGTTGCLRIPAIGPLGARYVIVVASTSSQRTTSGVQGGFLFRASSPAGVSGAPAAVVQAEAPVSGTTPSNAAAFDAVLREKERQLAADPRNRPGPLTAPAAVTTPVVGEHKSFQVCTTLQCTTFGTVAATLQYVGQHVAVYLDDDVPSNDPLQPADFQELGLAFDTYHYPIDTTAFGRESDLDNNGVVDILMTDAVNALTPNCTNGRVVGYFFGGDLLNGANSNHAEVFYTLVPAPATPTCTPGVTRRAALNNLKPTLIHEFQHMISYNQHVLLRGGSSEETWLNEALSHFAEELGGRLVPNEQCTASGFVSCRSQYASGDLLDSYDYMKDPEKTFMVYPNSSNGTLEERGASWMFLRWVLDHYAADSILATATTRALVGTTRTGAGNLTAVTGDSFSAMVPEWLLAAYLDDGTELPEEPTGHLRYKSWGFRSIWTDPRNQTTASPPGPFDGFPLNPVTIGNGYKYTGTLRGGSGKHFIFDQASNGASLDIQVLKSDGSALDPALVTRFAIVRVR